MSDAPPTTSPPTSGSRDGLDRTSAIIRRLLAEETETTAANWRADVRRLWHTYLRPFRGRFLAAAIVTIAWSFVPFGFALTWRFLIDHVLMPAHAGTPGAGLGERGVLLFFLMNSGIWAAHLACDRTRSWLVNTTSQNLVLVLRRDLHQKLAALHIGFFDRTPVGRLISRVMDDVNVIQQTAVSSLVYITGPIVKLVYGPAMLLYLDWRLAVPSILMLPVFGLAFLTLRRRIQRTNIALRRINSRTYSRAAERVNGVRIVQAFTRERGESRALAHLMAEFVRVAMRLVNYEQGLGLIQQALSAGTTAGLLFFGALAVRDGTMTLGDLVAFIGALGSVLGPVNELMSYCMQIQSAQVVVHRAFNLLDEEVTVKPGQISLDGMVGAIAFEGVTFRYPGQKRPALDGVSFAIQPGEKVALMGPSGSGKSTIFHLLLRFYDPQQGAVRVGGVDLRHAHVNSLRRHVCLVQQEPMLFSGTIAENITYGRADALPIDVARAAKAADFHDFVMAQPFFYHTEIGEGGLSLSGGQRQRLALATALLTQPEILLLDDTTSALDAATEARIRETLRQVLQSRTSLVITQRVITARDCDRILILERGRLVQSGTHAELLAQDGFYRAICEQQGQV
ncbi:MAG: ABC transporter ATP-binding protein/permease [Lentisphaerae bacterium]|nr:ABC transporter ATP-binding protein/permease [Lentisphaerota bacterium]